MAYFKSSETVDKNKEKWQQNLPNFQHKKRSNIEMEEKPIDEKCKMPLKKHIIGRYIFLTNTIKEKKSRMTQISKEIVKLWETKLNFPCLSPQVVLKKIEKLVHSYENHRKSGKSFEDLNELFDVTKADGNWLSKEDKNLYQLQKESNGKIGYASSSKHNPPVHPSKKRTQSDRQCVSNLGETSYDMENLESCKSSESETDTYLEESVEEKKKGKYHKSKYAANLVSSSSISTNKAAKVCKNLHDDGLEVPTPHQSSIFRSTMKKAILMKKEMIENLKNEEWSLHFDGKKINHTEYQVVVIKNENKEIKLSVLKLADGRAETIASGIANVLEEFQLWNSIVMIIADTTSVNTGRKTGVVVRLQKMFNEKAGTNPKFYGCQHHILDRILRLVMDNSFGSATATSPDIEYPFVKILLKDYEKLKKEFKNGEEMISESVSWRDDMKFLHHLTQVYRFYEEKKEFPSIKFQKLPNLSQARWNSRAILAILAFILIPENRSSLRDVCKFISNSWANFWFSDQLYKENDFASLSTILQQHQKALNTLRNHWSQETSPLNIPRSNQCAERAIKIMQELQGICKKHENLQLRFILTNNNV